MFRLPVSKICCVDNFHVFKDIFTLVSIILFFCNYMPFKKIFHYFLIQKTECRLSAKYSTRGRCAGN